jgi:hypothetical protein
MYTSGELGVGADNRAKVIWGKVLQGIEDGSLAEAYCEWETKGGCNVAGKLAGGKFNVASSTLSDAIRRERRGVPRQGANTGIGHAGPGHQRERQGCSASRSGR